MFDILQFYTSKHLYFIIHYAYMYMCEKHILELNHCFYLKYNDIIKFAKSIPSTKTFQTLF